MPFGDIPRQFCFSLSDFHEFEYCPFRFFVKHHLEKKYELEKGSELATLGNLLDLSIKFFHSSKAYGVDKDYLPNIVRRAAAEIKEKINKGSGKLSFYSAAGPFLTEGLVNKACQVFQNYYVKIGGKIKRSLGEVGFCEYVIEGDEDKWKLWGGPDAYEEGLDGMPEVCDYKYKEDIDKGRESLDMDLMPKIYVLLASKFLQSKGYDRARFVVRFWNDPGNDDFYEEFELNKLDNMVNLFTQKIQRILTIDRISFCEKDFCVACNSKQRNDFIKQLETLGLNFSEFKE